MQFPVNPTKNISKQSCWLCPSTILFVSPLTTALPSALDLAARFQLIKQIFAPEAFESAALAFAADFDWPDGVLSRDRDLLQSLGSLDMVLDHHSAIHRAAGCNPERIHQWLSSDPRLSLLLTMATRGG